MLFLQRWIVLFVALRCSLSSSIQGLYLTPLIRANKILQARNDSKVNFFAKHDGVKANSGYITVQPKSHMLFLFLRATEAAPKRAPLVLWLQGGPVNSGLFGQFCENGPIGIDTVGRLYNRTCTLQREGHVLYVDYPAGAGFSIIEEHFVLSRSVKDVTDDLHAFLVQFYQPFEEFVSASLYIAGESYGGRAAVSLAHRPQETRKHPSGVILSSGFVVPIQSSILKSHEFLYQLKMVDAEGRYKLAERFRSIRTLAAQNTSAAAVLLGQTVFKFNIGGKRNMFPELTGYSDQNSVLNPNTPDQRKQYVDYVNTTAFKEALHISPRATPDGQRLLLNYALGSSGFFNDISNIFISVLTAGRVLLIHGQMDDIFPPVTFEEYISKLNWSGAHAFQKAKRKP